MLFNSIPFVIFLIIAFTIYWIIPNRFRIIFLLIASYYFYMNWNPVYVLLIIMMTIIAYISGMLIEKNYHKKTVLATSILLLLGTLFFFKYFDFLCNNIINVLGLLNIQLSPVVSKLVLPVGISFYTFQIIGYCIDVYRGEKAEHNIITLAAFVSYFPQLVAGPIERTRELLPQLKKEKKFNYDQATYGLKLMAWGYFKKICIADMLAKYVDKVFANVNNYFGFALVIVIFMFAVQIYCDFSGYSDIAVGVSKLFGIDLMKNFKSPYFSKNIKEFWSRWHISLSSWFKDYLYIPLGGNRKGKIRTCINYLIVFLTSGLWHGANLTFVFWGFLHGVAQVFENLFFSKNKRIKKIPSFIRVMIIFVFCTLAFVFFRASSINEAFLIFRKIFSGITHFSQYIKLGLSSLNISNYSLFCILFPLVLLGVFDYFSLKSDVIKKVSDQKNYIRWTIYVVFALFIIFSIPVNTNAEFIYFQF